MLTAWEELKEARPEAVVLRLLMREVGLEMLAVRLAAVVIGAAVEPSLDDWKVGIE